MRRLGIALLLLPLLLAPAARADDPALELRWHLDISGSSSPDSSGHGHDATPHTQTPGRFFDGAQNAALYLDDNVDYGLPQSANVSVVAWVRSLGVPTDGTHPGWVVSYGGEGLDDLGGCPNEDYGLRVAPNGNLSFAVDQTGGLLNSPTVGPLQIWDGAWHAVTGTFNGSSVELYVDGQRIGSGTAAATPIAYNSGPARFNAGWSCHEVDYYSGGYDEVRMYSKALSPAEIQWLHGSIDTPRVLPVPAPPENVTLRHPLENIAGGSTPDISGNNIDGFQLQGTAATGRFGQALTTGVSDGGYLFNGGLLLKPQSFTAMAWAKFTGGTPVFQTIVGQGGGGCSASSWAIRTMGNGDLSFYVTLFGALGQQAYVQTTVYPAAQIWDGNWHAIAATYEDGVAKLWVDGVVQGTGGAPNSQTLNSEVDYARFVDQQGAVGRYPSNGCAIGNFPGAIDEVRVYDRVLTDNQIINIQAPGAVSPPADPASTPLQTPTPTPTPTAAPTGTPVPEPGLSLKWHLDDNTGGVFDSSGNGLHGRVDRADPISPARFDGGISVPKPIGGTDTRVGVGRGDSALLEPEHPTLMAWIRRGPTSDRNGTIAASGTTFNCVYAAYRFFMQADGTTGFSTWTPGAGQIATGGVNLADGQWHAIAGTYDGSQLRFYVDGAQSGSATLTGPRIRYGEMIDHGFQVGDFGLNGCNPRQSFTGDVDEVRVYRRVLTPTEIAYLQAGYHRTPPSLPIPTVPTNTIPPSLSGTPKLGNNNALSCIPGTWVEPINSRTYIWERAPRSTTSQGDGSWAPIDGATGTTYVLQPIDESSRVRCREIAVAAIGTGEAVSTSLRVDTDVPSVTTPPTVTGNPVLGEKLTCEHGSWTHGPDETDYAYSWFGDGLVIAGANAKTYTITRRYNILGGIFVEENPAGDGDRQMSCTVVAANDVGASAPAASTNQLHAVDTVPYPKARPTVTVSGESNPLQRTASCDRGTWYNDYANAPGFEDEYQWYRAVDDRVSAYTPINGATGKTFPVSVDVLGRYLRCQVRPANPIGRVRPFGPGAQVVDAEGLSASAFVPLPGGSTAGTIDTAFRNNRKDPINLMATSDAYRLATHNLFAQKSSEALLAVAAACDKPGGRANEKRPQALIILGGVSHVVLTPPEQCWVLNHDRTSIGLTSNGYIWDDNSRCDANNPETYGSCRPVGIQIQPVNPETAPSLPADVQAALAPVTPVRVLWDIDNDGSTDIACPGSSPVIRGNFDVGLYRPRAVIVNPDSAATGQFVSLQRDVAFPNAEATKRPNGQTILGAKRRPLQPLWCRNSVTPPPDPKLAPCTSSGLVGRVQLQGNMCPMNVRAIDDAAVKDLPADLRAVILAAADEVNEAERQREQSQPGYSAGLRVAAARAALQGKALPSPEERVITATAFNTVGSYAGLGTASLSTTLDAKLDKAFEQGSSLDKQVKQIQADAGVKNPLGIVSENAQFALDQLYTASGPLTANGVKIDPTNGKIPTLIIPSDVGNAIPGVNQMTILSQKAEAYLKSPQDAVKDVGKIAIQEADKQFKTTVSDIQGRADKFLKENINLDAIGKKLDLGPFKLTGSKVSVELNDDGTVTLHALAKLPGLTNAIAPPAEPNAKAGDPISIGIDLRGDLNGTIKLQGVQLKVPKAYLVGVQLEGLSITYNAKGLDVSGLITFPLSGGEGIQIANFRLGSDGEFLGVQVYYLAGAGRGIQVAPGVFLTKIGGGFSIKPYEITGGAAVSAGLPSSGSGCPTVGIDGGVTFHWNPVPLFMKINGTVVIACIPLANLDFYVDDTGWIKAHGDWKLDIPIVKLSAVVNGEFVTSPNNIWQMDAKGSADFDYLPIDDVTLKGALSNQGVAGCGSVTIDPFIGPKFTLSAGAAVKFSGGRPPLTYIELLANFRAFLGCDLGAFTPLHAIRQAGGPQVVTLPKGRSALSIEGAGAAPHVTITAPGGKVYDYTGAVGGAIVEDTFGTIIEQEDRTVVVLPFAKAGQYKIEAAPGSTPIVRVQRAGILDKPSVKATLSGKGDTRVLKYNIATIKGQTVTFSETARSAQHILKTIKGGGRGKLTFRLAETRSPKRTIEAQVYQDGIPRERIEVAHFTAKNPGVPRAKVTLRRKGAGAKVSWKAVRGAVRYDVRAAYPDGRNLVFEPNGKARSLVVPGVGKRGAVKVTVVSYTQNGRQSTSTAKLRAPKPHKGSRH